MNTRESKLEEKKSRILTAAEQLITMHGIEGASVREICKMAKVSPAMISYYFGCKEAMLAHIYEHRLHRAKSELNAMVIELEQKSPEVQLKEIVKFLTTKLFRFNRLLNLELKPQTRDNQPFRNLLHDFFTQCIEMIDDTIKRGIHSGVFTFATKAEDLFAMAMGTTLFVIRNQDYFFRFSTDAASQKQMDDVEKKYSNSVLLAVFCSLGYNGK